jgi:integrase
LLQNGASFEQLAAQRFKSTDLATSGGDLGYFTVDEMTRIMTSARGEYQLYLAIGAFLGVRPEETKRLDWSMFHINESTLMLPQMVHANDRTTKTGKPRSMPIPENLKPLLQWHAKPAGRLFPLGTVDRMARDFVKGMGILWSNDKLRKSAATYLLAKTQNAGQVATWLGNSDDVLRDRYVDNELLSQADRYFSISIPVHTDTPNAVEAR